MFKSVSFKPTSEARDSMIRKHIINLRESAMSRNSSRLPRDTSYFQRESMRAETFISTITKPKLLREVDEEAWYELTEGNGGLFQERMDFCNNAYLTLKRRKQDIPEVESIFDEPKGYDDMNEKDADKFVEMRMKNPVYEIGGLVKTGERLFKSKNTEQYEAKMTKYKKIDHSVMVEFSKGFEYNIYQLIREELILKNKSPHFLFNFRNSVLSKIPAWYGEDNLDYDFVLICEKPHGKLYDYLINNGDAEIPFFYWNVFFQALIALAQFHRSTGASMGKITYDNLYYNYSADFDGLPDDVTPFDNEAPIRDMLYYEYVFNNEDNPSYNFFTPALNINVILHGFGNSKPRGSLKDILKDYDQLFNLFIRKEDGGNMPDEANAKNKGFSKSLLSYKTKIMKSMLEQNIPPYTAAANMVYQWGEKIGLKDIKGVKFYEIDQEEPIAINDDPFVI